MIDSSRMVVERGFNGGVLELTKGTKVPSKEVREDVWDRSQKIHVQPRPLVNLGSDQKVPEVLFRVPKTPYQMSQELIERSETEEDTRMEKRKGVRMRDETGIVVVI